MLLSKGDKVNVNIRDYENYTPLHHACIYQHLGIVKQLLSCKADLNAASSEGYTPLHAASLVGNATIVRLLIQNGADPHFADNLGFTPLAFAVREQHEEVVNLLLRSTTPQMNIRTSEGFSPFHISCCRTNAQIVRQLLPYSNINERTNQGFTPLHLAAMHGTITIVRVLLERNADLYARDRDNLLPIEYAERYDHRAVVELLRSSMQPAK